jgi:hypothetical protein
MKMNLPEEFVQAVDSMNEEAINALVAKVAKDDAAIQEAKEDDQQLYEAKLAYQDASALYRESAKMAKLKIKFLRERLASMGKNAGEVPEKEDEE